MTFSTISLSSLLSNMRRLKNGLLAFILAGVVFLGAAVFMAYMNPRAVTTINQKGIDYAADAAVAKSKKLIADGGIPLGDHSGSYNGYFGGGGYSLSDAVISRLEDVRLGAKIAEDNGLKVSLGIAETQLRGRLYYSGSVLRIPISSNRLLAFNLTVSSISINFTVTWDIDPHTRLIESAIVCDASISSVELSFEPNDAWITKLLGGSGGSTMAWLLSKTVCTEIKNNWTVVIKDTNRYLLICYLLIQVLSMCILVGCTLILVLIFLVIPVFWKIYVETRSVEIGLPAGDDGARILPPFVPRRLQEHRGTQTAVCLSPHVAYSMLYALYRSGRFAFKMTSKDLLAKLQDDNESSAVGLCLARFLDRHFLDSRLEVEFSATCCPRFEVWENFITLTIQSDLTINTIRDNSTTSTLATFPTNVCITGRAYIDGNRICFGITNDAAKQRGLQDSTSVEDGIGQLLAKIFEREIISTFSELGKVGIPLPE